MGRARSDAELVERARSGDRAAFQELLDRHVPRVRRFLYRVGARAAELDDLAQEVFLVVIRGLSELREAAHFCTWLLGIALNVARGAQRRSKALELAPVHDGELDPQATPDVVAETSEQARVALRSLARLPVLLREAFVLQYVENLTPKEVATALGVNESTARSRVFEARQRLRADLACEEQKR